MEQRLPQLSQAATLTLRDAMQDQTSAFQPAPAGARLRLTQLAANALQSQPLILSAGARARVDEERVEQARAAVRPSATGVTGYQQQLENGGTTVPSRNVNAGVQLAVPLYRPLASAGIETARYQFESTSAAKLETGRDLLAALASAYVSAAQFEEETTLLAAERDGLLAQRNLNQRRMQGGVGTLVEVLETAARAELIQAQVRASEGNERSQLAEVTRLANMAVTRVQRLRTEVPGLIVPPSAEVALAMARRENSTLLRLRLAADSARANVKAQQAGTSPTVDLIGSIDRNQFVANGITSQAPSALLGVRVAVPFFNGGLIDSRVREAQAALERAEADVQDAESTLLANTAKAYADLDRAREQIKANNAALAIAVSALKATVKAFDAGIRGNIDVLNAQQQTFSGRRESMRASAAFLLAQIRILALTGLLNLETIARLETALSD